MKKIKKAQSVIGLSILTAIAGFSLSARAGGFQLFEENVTNLGNAYAGTSAEADDASTEYFNPAGMTRLDRPQFVISGTYIGLDTDVHINSATTFSNSIITLPPLPPIPRSTALPIFGSTDIRPGRSAVIPSFHFVYPFCHQWALGFGANVPFGLETIYPEDSAIRNVATTSAIETVDVGPSIAYQIDQYFSLGAGLDALWTSATFDQGIPNPLGPTGTLGFFTNEGDSWGWGGHAGVLVQINPGTRIGLTYHSQVKEEIEGRALASITIGPIPPFLNTSFPADIAGNFSSHATLPDWIDLSGYHEFNEQWAGLASVEYTRWSTIQTLIVHYSGNIAQAVSTAQLPFDFRNTVRVAGGLNYKPTPKWTLRTGLAWDESPVRDAITRTFRLPDDNRFWLALGAQYIITPEFTIDAGYTHLFISNTSINNTQFTNGRLTIPIANANIVFNSASNGIADVKSNVNEVGIQLTWNIM